MLTLKDFLASEVVPALGCTEPGAVALAVARARAEVQGDLVSLHVVVSRSIHKNGMSVGVPGGDGLKGNDVAAALSWFYGNADYGLEVLKDTPPEGKEQALALLASGKLVMIPDMDRPGVYVSASVVTTQGKAEAILEGKHDNIVKVIKDGVTVFDKSEVNSPKTTESTGTSVNELMAVLNFEDALAIAGTMTEEDEETLMRGVVMNYSMASYGLEHTVGLSVGKTIADSTDKGDIAQKIKAWTAAAADARMSGVMMPVMSSAGSGNHGLTAVIPVALYAEHLNRNRHDTAYALAISHIVTSFVKSRTGRLTPICGCSVAAGAGAAAGLAWLRTGDLHKAANAVSLILGNLSGMICDGAKASCALKVGSGASEAFYSALLAVGNADPDRQGLIGLTVEQSVKDLARMSIQGMEHMDDILCKIITE